MSVGEVVRGAYNIISPEGTTFWVRNWIFATWQIRVAGKQLSRQQVAKRKERSNVLSEELMGEKCTDVIIKLNNLYIFIIFLFYVIL